MNPHRPTQRLSSSSVILQLRYRITLIRKQAEEALLLSRERLEEAQRIAIIGNWEANLVTGELYWSQVIFDIFGFDSESFKPSVEEFYKAVHPSDRDLVLESEKRSEQTGLHDVVHRIVRPNGEVRFIHELAKRYTDNNGNLIMLRGTVQDITERKQMEQDRRVAEEKYSSIFENAVEGIFQTTMDGRLLSANPALANIFGYESPKDLMASVTNVGRQLYASQEEREKNLLLINEKGVVNGFEAQGCRKDGSSCWISINTRLVKNGGDPIYYEGFVADITDRKQAEADKEKLESQKRQLQKTESLGRMAGAIAHHFNNQLGVVIGNMEMAIDDLPQSVGAIKKLTTAMDAANRAAEMSILMLTYLGQSSDKHEPIDLSEVCLRSIPIIQLTIANNVVLKHDLRTSGPVISANANQIRQVMTNLTTNALEAIGEDGGIIHLRVKTIHPDEISSAHRYPLGWQPQDNPYACLEVVDTGYGIKDEDIEKLYDPFFSTKFTGRGLGLPVVMGIVKAHGGAVTVESEPGRGSTFRVFFPMSGEEVLRQLDKATQAQETRGGGTVLLVEDEEMVRDMAAAMLTRLGFTVLEAKDGVEAVEVFRQHQDEVICVLSDLTMPRMNGWETLTALRKLAPDIPVILASGYDKAQVMAGDHSELPQVFLGKPYKLKGLSDAIAQALVCRN